MKNTKYITTKEVARLMGVPLVTVSRWAHQGKIPCKLNHHGYIFNRSKIISWAKSHQFHIQETEGTIAGERKQAGVGLREAIERGGVFYDLEGNDIYSVLENAVNLIELPVDTDKERLLNELINREEIASTGIGNGVAIPHPRRPFNLSLQVPVMPVFFLKKNIDFNSVDGKPVFVIFLIFSPTTKIHLEILARLSFCLRDKKFMSLIRGQVEQDSLLKTISHIESELENTEKHGI